MGTRQRAGGLAVTNRFHVRVGRCVSVPRDECIKSKPIYDWPLCHCLISFYSTGFPLEKAEAYIRLRHPFCINNLSR